MPGALIAFRAELARYFTLPFYRAMLEASGLEEDLAAFDRNREVSDRLTRTLGGVGGAETARAYVQAYRDAGTTLPAIRPITFPDAPWYLRTVEEASAW